MTTAIDPAGYAQRYVDEVAQELSALNVTPKVVGFIASQDKPSLAYARATRKKFADIGIEYELRRVERLELEAEIRDANVDPDVHGIFIYFPVFHHQQDDYLRNIVNPEKDIEAGSSFWVNKLYANDRLAVAGDPKRKALLPCTPLAIVNLLNELGTYTPGNKPLAGKTVTIFNRSEVIGRPLAVMLSNDGALVYSFDEYGPLQFQAAKPAETEIDRQQALATSDIVITGVPVSSFPKISATEILPEAVCINFSSIDNFDANVIESASIYLPRIGPMTVAMCMRNTLRLYKNFVLHE